MIKSKIAIFAEASSREELIPLLRGLIHQLENTDDRSLAVESDQGVLSGFMTKAWVGVIGDECAPDGIVVSHDALIEGGGK